MALTFGSTFSGEFDKFVTLSSAKDFLASVVPFVQFAQRHLEDPHHPFHAEIKSWKVTLFNSERHHLYPHQVAAIKSCVESVVLSDEIHSGYCFMPTSAGKGHILMTLAGLAVGDFQVQKLVYDTMPDVWSRHPDLFPVLVSLGLLYARITQKSAAPRTQILVHDTEILKQIEGDCESLLGGTLKALVEFHSVQALRNPNRKANLKYVIIDECHWGNASEEETIQSRLISEVTEKGGKAFGFTASPYSDGKFLKTWSQNRLSSDLDFNYYLDNNILYPITLREVNLQNARVDFVQGENDEIDLTEKDQVIDFMTSHIATTLPAQGLDGPGICFFSAVIIPDMVEALFKKRPDLKPLTKVLASDSAFFATKCVEMFGPSILATDDDIARLKKGETVFLISRQKLLVGLNAPFLRYCFISPTNSKITIMQGIGRLMRPVDFNKVPRKLATLFLTSLSGKKLSIGGKGAEPGDEADEGGDEPDIGGHDDPKSRYTTSSMTLSEAYDLPVAVFYKTEVGFRDFINQTRIKDGNTVEFIGRKAIDPEDLEKFDPIALRNEVNRIRSMVRAQYKHSIVARDSRSVGSRKVWFCQGKRVLGESGCARDSSEVNLEIHHMHPFTFASLFSKLGADGVLAWHANADNLQHLVTLCEVCHDKLHALEDGKEEVA